MKLTASELRIGNYVDTLDTSNEIHLPNNRPMKIGKVCFFDIRLYDINKSFAEQLIPEKTDISILTPIPLTEEWLLKFGFEYSTMGIFKFRDFVVIKWSNEFCEYKEFDATGNSRRTIILKYIHSLQNLYFALTNKELTISE